MSCATEYECLSCGARQWVGDIIIGVLLCDECGAYNSLRRVATQPVPSEQASVSPSGIILPSGMIKQREGTNDD